MIFFLPLNFFSVKALDKYGLRVGVLWGIVGTCIGLWIKCFVNYSFAFVIVGQTFCAISCPFLYNAPAKVTSNWFAEKERAVATMVGTLSSFVGLSLGFVVPVLIISPYYDTQSYTEA